MEAAFESCREDEELREEARKRRDACQREQCQCHQERQLRISGIQPVIVFKCELACPQCHNRDNGKYGKIGKHIYQHVVYQRRHTLCASADDTQHDVTCLRDTGESHQPLQVLLAQGEEVGNCDGGDDNPVQHFLPLLHHRSEYLDENSHQHESGRAFRDDTQIGCHRAWSTFVNVCCPKMERHQ